MPDKIDKNILFIITGCSKNDTKNVVDNTVGDFIGKSAIDRGEKMKKQLKQMDEKRKKDLEETGGKETDSF